MPDTFLIDRKGRIAAAYAGLVDKDDVEANIKTCSLSNSGEALVSQVSAFRLK